MEKTCQNDDKDVEGSTSITPLCLYKTKTQTNPAAALVQDIKKMTCLKLNH